MRFQSDVPDSRLPSGTLQTHSAADYDYDFYIECDGARIDEYYVKKECNNIMSCFVASVQGKASPTPEHRLRCNNKTNWWLAVQCSIDGRCIVEKCGCPPLQDSPAFQMRAGVNLILPFLFKEVALASPDIQWMVPDPSHLGLIELRVWRCRAGQARPWPHDYVQSSVDAALFKYAVLVGEQSKAMHCTVLGSPEPVLDNIPTANHIVRVIQFLGQPMSSVLNHASFPIDMLGSIRAMTRPLIPQPVAPTPVRLHHGQLQGPWPQAPGQYVPRLGSSGPHFQAGPSQYAPVAPAASRPNSISSVGSLASAGPYPFQAPSRAGSIYAPSEAQSIAVRPPSSKPSIGVDGDQDEDDDDAEVRSLKTEMKVIGLQVEEMSEDMKVMKRQLDRIEAKLTRIVDRPSLVARTQPANST
ncbi:uncharacterized protein B0H18DRAFT_1115148 [Fomitopsis serialis]|uniref:uncharacterized protein n=1 Tax=Fomitopsis serialis TaxID=139415 RepID=UPI0020080451|nr:uncharacterized protein B0H18DRAFT_1115148 [Neoantrodia serialis]KAH9933767.1 hypothetical protein B0H18DRAFT_1115148 [Neoantrodia serialis]